MITIAAAILTANLGITSMLRSKAPAPTCGIKTVSYRFVGEAGTKFRYDGATYVIPRQGSIELVAARAAEYEAAGGRSLPLDVWPIDPFGTRTVRITVTSNNNVAPPSSGSNSTATPTTAATNR
jgi:hypothetical protein